MGQAVSYGGPGFQALENLADHSAYSWKKVVLIRLQALDSACAVVFSNSCAQMLSSANSKTSELGFCAEG